VVRDLVLVLYRVVARTSLMTESRQGERLRVLGPLGKSFPVPERNSSRLLVGGGIGIAPLLFLSQFHKGKDTVLMTGFRSAKHILSPQKIIGDQRGFLVATDDGTQGRRGPVTDLLDEFLRKGSRDVAVYACGPRPMLKKVAETSMALRIPAKFPGSPHGVGLGLVRVRQKGSATSAGATFTFAKKGQCLKRKRLIGKDFDQIRTKHEFRNNTQ
jgi:dihydroorotate dehydrogenase electron transfer subunit